MKEYIERHPFWLFWLFIIVLLFFAISGFFYYRQAKELSVLERKAKQLEKQLITTESALSSTTAALQTEVSANENFAEQVGRIQGTVATLDKLSKTDPELLRRYSQVYFLPDNYVPGSISEIDKKYWGNEKEPEKIHSSVKRHLEDMLAAASSSKAEMIVISGYRSFGEQGSLKQRYTVTYGTGANKFSADQGYSEHQLGTAVDLSTRALGGLTGFEKSQAYAWLSDNAHRYGFILSYPEKNVYFQFEPWHWRFVGVRLATYLYNTNKYFFSLPQREINAYLVDLFDY